MFTIYWLLLIFSLIQNMSEPKAVPAGSTIGHLSTIKTLHESTISTTSAKPSEPKYKPGMTGHFRNTGKIDDGESTLATVSTKSDTKNTSSATNPKTVTDEKPIAKGIKHLEINITLALPLSEEIEHLNAKVNETVENFDNTTDITMCKTFDINLNDTSTFESNRTIYEEYNNAMKSIPITNKTLEQILNIHTMQVTPYNGNIPEADINTNCYTFPLVDQIENKVDKEKANIAEIKSQSNLTDDKTNFKRTLDTEYDKPAMIYNFDDSINERGKVKGTIQMLEGDVAFVNEVYN